MDSSFVDVFGKKDSQNINSDESSKSSRMSEADEWLDVDVVTSSTTNEERLRKQVRALQRALDEKNLELMESNVQVDLLKGHKILLENAKSDLQEDLTGQAKLICRLQNDLNSSNKQMMEKEEELQSTKTELLTSQEVNKKLNEELSDLRHVYEKEGKDASMRLQDSLKVSEELKANLINKEEFITNRNATLTKLEEEKKTSKEQQVVLSKTIASLKKENESLQQQVVKLKTDAGSIAVVAENHRGEKQDLGRKLQLVQGKLQQSQLEVQELQRVLAKKQRMYDQKEEESKERQMCEQRQKEHEINSLTEILSSKTRELEDSKSVVTQLVGEVATAHAESDYAKGALEELKRKHEDFVVEHNHFREDQLEREELLRLELDEIQSANEKRLEELRQILGLRFRDVLVRSKGSKAGRSPSSLAPTKKTGSSGSGSYVPPPILRTVMGLV